MGTEVQLFYFRKRANSTKKPTDEIPLTYDCVLHEPFSILSPTIIIKAESDWINTTYNYAYIPAFGRYYNITNWEYVNGRWFATLQNDTLASWRELIGYMKPYIVRSSAQSNQTIIDTLYPTKTNPQILQTQPENAERWHDLTTSGIYVISVVNNDNRSGSGGISYYAMTRANFLAFRAKLLGSADYLNISADEISSDLAKALVNPSQYITSCFWVPVAYSSVPTTETSVLKVGWWNIDTANKLLPGNSLVDTFDWDFDIPSRSDGVAPWRYNSHLSKYTLTIPCYGMVEYDAHFVTVPAPIGKIKVRVALDCMTGVATFRVYSHTADLPIMEFDSMVGVQIPLAFGNRDIIGGVGSIAQGAITLGGAIASAGAVGAVASAPSVLGNIASAVDSFQQKVSTSGNAGSFAKFLTHPTLTCTYYYTISEDNNHFGRPCDIHNTQIKDLPGYIKCADADCDLPCTAEEKAQIEQYLLNGMYYE